MTSTEEHRAAMNSYMDECIAHAKDVKDFVNVADLIAMIKGPEGAPPAPPDPEKIQEFTKDLQAKMLEHQKEALTPQVRELWTKFDKNGDGVLSGEECQALVTDYLSISKERMPEIMRNSMAIGLEVSLQMLDTLLPPETPEADKEQIKGQVKAQMDMMVPMISDQVCKVFTELEKDTAKIAEELLEKMDKNHDGMVTQAEFEDQFFLAMQNIVDPQKMAELVQQGGGMPAPA